MKLDAGDIVLLPFPHTNLKAGKKRPALVLTDAKYNRASSDVVLAFVTSQQQAGDWSLAISTSDLSKGKLVKDSWVRVDRLATVEQVLVRSKAGRLGGDALAAVRQRLVVLLGE